MSYKQTHIFEIMERGMVCMEDKYSIDTLTTNDVSNILCSLGRVVLLSTIGRSAFIVDSILEVLETINDICADNED